VVDAALNDGNHYSVEMTPIVNDKAEIKRKVILIAGGAGALGQTVVPAFVSAGGSVISVPHGTLLFSPPPCLIQSGEEHKGQFATSE
jgi:hypothetical protein